MVNVMVHGCVKTVGDYACDVDGGIDYVAYQSDCGHHSSTVTRPIKTNFRLFVLEMESRKTEVGAPGGI